MNYLIMNEFFYFFIFLSYLLGSIPFGLLISKLNGIDIRLHGSKNIGATNVFRVLGKKYGLITFFLDALKGFIPTFFFPIFLNTNNLDINTIFGLLAIIGHTFPLFLKFKGGKGVATSAGMLIGVVPLILLIGLFIWIILFLIYRFVSLASIISSIIIAILVWFNNESSIYINFLITLMSLMIILLHRGNIKRLINGTENKFKK